MRRLPILAASILLAMPLSATPRAAVHVDGWARATVPAQTGSAAYLSIHNAELKAVRLLAVSTPAAASASVHHTSTAGGVVRMRAVGVVPIGPGATVAMKPGGLHVMLTGLKAPLKSGKLLPLTLRFARAGTVRVSVPIRAQGSDAGHRH